MNLSTKPDLVIVGSGSNEGGDFGSVRIAGSGRIDGSLSADQLSVSGTLYGKEVQASSIRVSGTCQLQGDASAQELNVTGSLTVAGAVRARDAHIGGTLRLEGSLKVSRLSASGLVDVEGDIEAKSFTAAALRCHGDLAAETLTLRGGQITGTANAPKIELSLAENLHISEMICDQLTMQPGRLLGILPTRSLDCPTITGSEITLCRTRSKLVKGRRVIIGKGCAIDRVEYTESLTIDPESQVGESVRV